MVAMDLFAMDKIGERNNKEGREERREEETQEKREERGGDGKRVKRVEGKSFERNICQKKRAKIKTKREGKRQ